MQDHDDIGKVLNYIDDFYRRCCERPEMFAYSPRCLEEVFVVLESLREFLLSDKRGIGSVNCGYFKFLDKEEPGQEAWCFTTRRSEQYRQSLSQDDERLFVEFVEFWQRYLSSPERMVAENSKG